MTSRAVDTPTPPDPFANLPDRDDTVYWNARQPLATPDPSIPERPDPPTYRDERLRDWTAGYDAGLRTALGSIPERPAEPLREALIANLDEAEIEAAYAKEIGKPGYAAAHLDGMIARLRAALESTPESTPETSTR